MTNANTRDLLSIASLIHSGRPSSIYLSYRSYPQEHAEVQSRGLFYALKGVTSANAEIITLASFSLAQIDQREREGAGSYREGGDFPLFQFTCAAAAEKTAQVVVTRTKDPSVPFVTQQQLQSSIRNSCAYPSDRPLFPLVSYTTTTTTKDLLHTHTHTLQNTRRECTI